MAKTVKAFPRIGNYSPVTNILIQRLRDGKPGQVITDEELAEVAGYPCAAGHRGYSNLMNAIRYCECEGVIWRRLRGQKSIACQKPAEVVEQAVSDLRIVHRKAKRTSRRLIMTDTSDLTNAEKVRHSALVAQAGTLVMVSHGTTRTRIAETPAPKALSLDAFLRTVTECAAQPFSPTAATQTTP